MRIGLKTKTTVGAMVVCVLASSVVAVLWLAVTDWFGVGDLTAFFWFSAPFAVLVGTISLLWSLISKRFRRGLAYSLGGVLGLLSGWVWTIAVVFYLGPWFLLFSFPVFFCWLFGGLCGVLFGVRYNGNI